MDDEGDVNAEVTSEDSVHVYIYLPSLTGRLAAKTIHPVITYNINEVIRDISVYTKIANLELRHSNNNHAIR